MVCWAEHLQALALARDFFLQNISRQAIYLNMPTASFMDWSKNDSSIRAGTFNVIEKLQQKITIIKDFEQDMLDILGLTEPRMNGASADT